MNVKQLQATINYHFKDEKLLQQALSHRSCGKLNNERLEFLGDSLVNLIIADALYVKHDNATEGELSRMRSSLVKGDTLAKVAKEFLLGDYLHLGPGEIKSGGHKRSSILAGALEALIGAICLDSDFAICQQVVLQWFKARLDNTDIGKIYKDHKTLLQEYLQSKGLPLPQYQLVDTTGAAHEQTFHVQCIIESLGKVIEQNGLSRRKAEQAAAQHMLKEIKDGK